MAASELESISTEGADMLMAAVRLARSEQIQKVAVLKDRMSKLFPGMEAAVDEGLMAWARYERAKASY